jgi:hypothetical protein
VIGVFFSSAGNIVFVANDYIGTESCQLQKAFVSFMISTLAVVDLCGRNAATNPPFFEGGGGGWGSYNKIGHVVQCEKGKIRKHERVNTLKRTLISKIK